ncbi:MAG: hypothetical protein M1118_05045 [Chloroflexi bacterium]|nr:hypothetical protein [Chloroflexota bacterium]
MASTLAYGAVLWLSLVPDYAVSVSLKALFGFLIAGVVAGFVGYSWGALCGIAGYTAVLLLLVIVATATAASTVLEPGFLMNLATANESTVAVGAVRGPIFQVLIVFASLGLILSAIGGWAGSQLRRTIVG